MTNRNGVATIDSEVASTADDGAMIPFQVDRGIIQHLVFNQGSDVRKAIMELVMNCIDADARTITIDITRTGFRCSDDGHGFKTREEIERCFETFGTPHEDGDAKYGRFRLGRGQIMSFATTKWQTNHWQMTVDVKEGMGFRLSTLEKPVAGCHIYGHWYEPLQSWQIRSLESRILSELRYIPALVTINDQTVGGGHDGEKWTHEDENAYYRIETDASGFTIYNMGVLVTTQPVAGLGGVIVTKKAISLNTSRTSIMTTQCDVWKQIVATVEMLGKSCKRPWTKERKEDAFSKILAHHPDSVELIRTAPLISLVGSSTPLTIGAFLFGGTFGRRGGDWRFSGYCLPSDSQLPIAESVASTYPGIAVVHPSVLGLMGLRYQSDMADTEAVFHHQIMAIHDYLCETVNFRREVCMTGGYRDLPLHPHEDFNGLSFRELAKTIDMSSRIVKATDCLKGEALRVWGAFKRPMKQYATMLHSGADVAILVGVSDSAEAWTDGSTYIAFSKGTIERLARKPLTEAARIFQILEHELAHCRAGCSGTSQGLEHDMDFYRSFHDMSLAAAPIRQTYIRRALKSYRAGLRLRKTATQNAAENKKAIAAGQKPRTFCSWEHRAAPQIVELCDTDAMTYYEIMILRMALVRDFDEPLPADSLDQPEDIIHILEGAAIAKDQRGKIDVDGAVSEAIKAFASFGDGEAETIKAIAVGIGTAASQMMRAEIGDTIRHLTVLNQSVFSVFQSEFAGYSWDQFLETIENEHGSDYKASRRTLVEHPESPFRREWLLWSHLPSVFRHERYQRSAYAARAGIDVICRIDPIIGEQSRTIIKLAHSLYRQYQGLPPVDVLKAQARRILNCIDIRGILVGHVNRDTRDLDDMYDEWMAEEMAREEHEGE